MRLVILDGIYWLMILTTSSTLAGPHSPPPPRAFSTYLFPEKKNTTVLLGDNSFGLALGQLSWPQVHSSNSSFAVVQSILSSDEISSILKLVQDPSLLYDEDPDSVDELATHEIYIQRNGNIEGVREIEGKLDQ
jgi:hypothetical protein